MKRIARCFALQVNGLLPFLYPLCHVVRRGNWFRGVYRYGRDYRRYRMAERSGDPFPLRFFNTYPQLFDRFEPAGNVPRHYFLQDLWAAQKVFASRVPVHYDIGSRVDGFIGHCAIFCQVVMLDIRPLALKVPNVEFHHADATDMSDIPNGSIPSLSSLHAVEHFGLGRYCDLVEPGAHEKALREMMRVLAPGGNLYLSVPVGRQRLEFNAHRVFDPVGILELLPSLNLQEFSVIDDAGVLRENVRPAEYRQAGYACGLFWFCKSV